MVTMTIKSNEYKTFALFHVFILQTYALMGCNELNHIPPELIEKLIVKGCKFLDLSICRKRPQVDMKCLPREVNLKGLKRAVLCALL